MTARELNWDRLRNGDLLAAAEDAGFDAMLTADQGIFYQQNNRSRKISWIVVSINHRPSLVRNLPMIRNAIEESSPGSFKFLPISKTPSTRLT